MKVLFFGSEDFSIPALRMLSEGPHEVVAVVTQPDRKKGRGHQESGTEVAEYAHSRGIPLLKPEKLKDPGFLETLKDLAPDLVVVCAYGKILRQRVLVCPRLGCINVHPSLLPRYRGATPIEAALRSGDTITGVTIFYMDEGCDTGDIIVQKQYPIGPDDTRGSLREKLSHFATGVLGEALELISEGKAPRCRQTDEGVCCTALIEKEDTFIDWSLPAENLVNFTRSLWPRPSAQTLFRGKLLKVAPLSMAPVSHGGTARPGEILEVRKNEGPLVATGKGVVKLGEVKPEGKKLMTAWQFSLGYSPRAGESFSLPEGCPSL
ncbi:MAG: methionyl-tRNA formyltransferase [Candidatus Eremiobacteraeota bacterium]|nr:methionyl-tRNA formyltransferase [Candidatus Eremiobacteraeota bacterium]